MLSKNQIRYINSLSLKKNRDQENIFVAEGEKIVRDIIHSTYKIQALFATKNWLDKESNSLQDIKDIHEITEDELAKISSLKTPQEVIIIIKKPKFLLDNNEIRNSLSIVLDKIQDPGNMGTIIRIANWFGIKHIFCSPDCVDVYNSKVIQASMGTICHVNISYTKLSELIKTYTSDNNFPIYGTLLDGENIYKTELKQKGFIVMGNESKGISKEIESLVSDKLLIPSFSPDNQQTDSLNVAVATAIVCSEFFRK